MRVALGGTFEVIHRGHRALLGRAFEVGDEVLIGLTSDNMAEAKGPRRPLEERRRDLEEYLRRQGHSNFQVSVLEDPYGPAVAREDLDAIVVSETTARTALALNQARMLRGLKPLQIITVPMALAEDSLPVSTTRILAGEVDPEGQMRRPLEIRVGSANRVKVAAVRAVASRVFSAVKVAGVEVASEVPQQPRGNDTFAGAIHRARAVIGEAGDYGVGIEAGLLWNGLAGRHFDVQVCAVVDRAGEVTLGHGPGFYYPPGVMALVDEGRTVSEAIEALTGIRDIGRKRGAIGYLTEGRMTRRRLTELAVLMALVPRIRRELYYGT